MAKTSLAKLKANDKYLKTQYEFKVRVKKERETIIKEHAKSKGMSLNEYVINLIEKDMESE